MVEMSDKEFFAKSIDRESINYNGFSVEYRSKDPLAKNHVDFFVNFLNGVGEIKYIPEQNMSSGFEKVKPHSECYNVKKSGARYATPSFFILFEPISVPSWGKPVKVSIQKMTGKPELLGIYADVLNGLSATVKQE